MTTKILLDENLDLALAEFLPGDLDVLVSTAQLERWQGKVNGELLQLAAASARFDVLITADKAMLSQQNERTLPLPVIVLIPSKRLGETRESLMSGPVADLLRQKLDNKFYVAGNGPRTAREIKMLNRPKESAKPRGPNPDSGR